METGLDFIHEQLAIFKFSDISWRCLNLLGSYLHISDGSMYLHFVDSAREILVWPLGRLANVGSEPLTS